MTMRVYEYGGVTIFPESEAFALQQAFLSHRWRNGEMENKQLVDRYRWRLAIRINGNLPQLKMIRDSAEQALKRAEASIEEYKGKHETKKLQPAQRNILAAAKANHKKANAAFKTALAAVNPVIKDRVTKYANARRRRLYKTLVSEGGMATSIYDYWRGKLRYIKKFRRWDGTGLIYSVNVQGNPRRCLIENIPDDANRKFKAGSRRQGRMKRASISHAPNKIPPVVFRFLAHRELPPIENIKQVHIFAEKTGPRKYYKVAFCADVSGQSRPANLAAVAWCWKRYPKTNKIHVCSWVGEDGRHGDLYLPAAIRKFKSKRRWYTIWDRLERVDDKQARRDNLFNDIKQRLKDFRLSAPTWFRDATQYLHAQKSPRHLVKLWHAWREQRFAGDEAMFLQTEEWMRTDRHWWTTQANQREATYRQRRELYRLFAANMAKRYGRIAIVAIKGPVGTDSELPNPVIQATNLLRRRVAASTLKSALGNKCQLGEVTVQFTGESPADRARMILKEAQAQLRVGNDIFVTKPRKRDRGQSPGG